jgi:hypothetical protein
MLHTFGKRIATLGVGLTAGVCLILCTGAAVLAAEATRKGVPSDGTTAAIAVPNFISYRNKSRVAAGVGSAEGVRAADTHSVRDQAETDGTEEEEVSGMPVTQDQRPSEAPQMRREVIDDSGSMNWERGRGLRTMPR